MMNNLKQSISSTDYGHRLSVRITKRKADQSTIGITSIVKVLEVESVRFENFGGFL